MPSPSIWASTDYALDWPREIVRRELVALYEHPFQGWTPAHVERLLHEAFHTDVPATDFRHNFDIELRLREQWAGRSWVDELLANVDQLREHTEPAPYWMARRSGIADAPPRADVRCRFAELVELLHGGGYLDREFSEACVTQDPDQHNGRDLAEELRQRLALPDPRTVWPLKPETWDTDTFYTLIEVLHDLVARPRAQWDCNDDYCGPHFHDFDTDAGRRIYRGLVNRVLAEHNVNLRLAEDGENLGRLVQIVDDGRDELVARALSAPPTLGGDRVRHAVELFRARAATDEDKRSAVVVLAGVLEERLPSSSPAHI